MAHHIRKFRYKGNMNSIPDIENKIDKPQDNLWLDDESLFEELIMSIGNNIKINYYL